MAKKISKNQKKSKKENKGKKKKENQNKNKKKIINFVSSNKNKLRELNEMFNEHFKDVEVKQLDIDLPESQGLPEDIVKGKLKIALEKSKNLKGPILVEDTSLCFNAYRGLPGPLIKYYLKAIKQEGLYKWLVYLMIILYMLKVYLVYKKVKMKNQIYL